MKKITTLLCTLALLVTSKALIAQDASSSSGYQINNCKTVFVSVDSSNLLLNTINVPLRSDETLALSFSGEDLKYIADFDLGLNSNLQFLDYAGYDQSNWGGSFTHHDGTVKIQSPFCFWGPDNNSSYHYSYRSFSFQPKGVGMDVLTFTRLPFDHWDISGPQPIVGETLPPLTINVTITP
jgi:hypothetical protein